METKDIIENNKLIASFMGAKDHEYSSLNLSKELTFVPFHGVVRNDTIETGKGTIMKYHKSWDWLMPVVEKIESLDFVVQIHLGSCFIKTQDQFIAFKGKYVAKSQGKIKIDNVYNAVIEFINWYNLNN